jgi:hypothetical protein
VERDCSDDFSEVLIAFQNAARTAKIVRAALYSLRCKFLANRNATIQPVTITSESIKRAHGKLAR